MAGERNKKETISFLQSIPANTTTIIRQPLKASGTLERIFGKFYVGQQLGLHARPYLVLPNERSEELITYPSTSNRYLAGDDESYEIYVDFEVMTGYEIRVEVTNVDLTNAYTLNMKFEVDYVGGTDRVI